MTEYAWKKTAQRKDKFFVYATIEYFADGEMFHSEEIKDIALTDEIVKRQGSIMVARFAAKDVAFEAMSPVDGKFGEVSDVVEKNAAIAKANEELQKAAGRAQYQKLNDPDVTAALEKLDTVTAATG